MVVAIPIVVVVVPVSVVLAWSGRYILGGSSIIMMIHSTFLRFSALTDNNLTFCHLSEIKAHKHS